VQEQALPASDLNIVVIVDFSSRDFVFHSQVIDLSNVEVDAEK